MSLDKETNQYINQLNLDINRENVVRKLVGALDKRIDNIDDRVVGIENVEVIDITETYNYGLVGKYDYEFIKNCVDNKKLIVLYDRTNGDSIIPVTVNHGALPRRRMSSGVFYLTSIALDVNTRQQHIRQYSISNTNVVEIEYRMLPMTTGLGNKYLADDGKYKEVLDINKLVQSLGYKDNVVISQKVITQKFDEQIESINNAIITANIAKNAVTNLEGLANSDEAMKMLAAQIVQIEENRTNIERLLIEAVLSGTVKEINSSYTEAELDAMEASGDLKENVLYIGKE